MTGSPPDDVPRVRLLVDEQPASGAWNMAVDEVLLTSAVQEGCCSLRWYRWQEATLSLGYFQQADDPLIEDRFDGLPRVRRLSGGGAILHERELTYACALGAHHALALRPLSLYAAMHDAIVRVLSEFGILLRARGETDRSRDAHFLCFNRGDANDLLYRAHKVLGSAQRRRRGAVLQHGSLLLWRSPAAPEFPGILDLCESPPQLDVLQAKLIEATTRIIGGTMSNAELTETERRLTSELAARAEFAPRPIDEP